MCVIYLSKLVLHVTMSHLSVDFLAQLMDELSSWMN